MRYKIFLSNSHDTWHYYIDDKERAKLLYRMATQSRLFTFVQLAEVYEKAAILDEWVVEQ